jgi:hypothetical protein
MGQIGYTYKISVENPERKRPLGRPRCRWERVLKYILKKYSMDMILEAQGQMQ